MSTYQPGDIRTFRVKLRSGPGFEVKPEAKPLDGLTLQFEFGWVIDDGDSRYPGESAWLLTYNVIDIHKLPPCVPAWLASGDLEPI